MKTQHKHTWEKIGERVVPKLLWETKTISIVYICTEFLEKKEINL